MQAENKHKYSHEPIKKVSLEQQRGAIVLAHVNAKRATCIHVADVDTQRYMC
jgi:peptidoglycan/xylan/chitin deacetylase (PgdA/CDA1 family)